MATLKEDYWTHENINLLVDKRISRDAIFKQTNSDRLGWLQVVGDMKKDGGSKALNRINVRKQWFKTCELYKKSLESNEENIRNELVNTPYYSKLCQFFEKNNTNSFKSKCMNQEYRNNISSRILKISSYADRWSIERTNALIDARIKRHSMFKGRGHAANAWRVITQDVIAFDEPHPGTITIQQVKKKWENLFTKYKAMYHTKIFDVKWPPFDRMHYFYTKVYKQYDELYESADDSLLHMEAPIVLADRWPSSRTKLLIERRIARAPMFGRGMSADGWQAVLNDLIAFGAPSDLTLANVKKKWENLLTRHKIIKDSKTVNPKWPYFVQMEKYHNLKKNRKYKKQVFEETDAHTQDAEHEINIEITDKFMKCRLCQEIQGDYSLVMDKNLCDRIVECTAINVYENIEVLPSKICETCKTLVDKFKEFRIMCHNINKELQDILQNIVIKTESNLDENKVDINSEVVIQKTPDTFECSECPASFTSSEVLEVHLSSHKNNVKYYCEICNVGFIKQSALFTHIEQHFGTSKLENDLDLENVEIEYLEERTEPENMKAENSHIILPDDIFQCELCSKTFTNESNLKDHFNTHSRTEHHCPRENCNKKFTTLNSLRHHEMRHLGLNSFLCTVCGKGFVTKNALKMHEKIHSKEKEHVCEICSRAFSVLSNLKAHQKKHHEGHRFYCSQCPKQFLTRCSLQRHELVHTGIKEFICDICSSAFFTLKELRKHKRYHENIRLYHCNECFKTFFEKHHLTIHMRSHTGERPFSCTISGCNKSFREKQKLQRHEKTPHRVI